MMGGSRSTRSGSFWGEACAMSEDIERTVSPAAPPGDVPAQRTARQRRPTGAPPPIAMLTVFLMGAVYCLVVPGRPRAYAKAAVAMLVAVFGLARLYLAVDHPDDILLGVALGVAIPVTAFRYFTPNEVFPVAYRRGRAAHVDVGGRRGDAIRLAVHDQPGRAVLE